MALSSRVDAVLDEEPCDVEMVVLRCRLERCAPTLVLGFRVGAVLDQEPCDIEITFGEYLMK
jgi:hypothetical protein